MQGRSGQRKFLVVLATNNGDNDNKAEGNLCWTLGGMAGGQKEAPTDLNPQSMSIEDTPLTNCGLDVTHGL